MCAALDESCVRVAPATACCPPLAGDGAGEILCVGVNPAYQTTLHFDAVRLGHVNRAQFKSHSIGGKGQNCAIAIKQLYNNFKVSVLQLIGGETGKFISTTLAERGIYQYNVLVQRKNRTCTTLLDMSGNNNTELVEPSELVTDPEYQKLKIAVLELLKLQRPKAIAICGSIPLGVEKNFYNLVVANKPENCFVLMDAFRDVTEALNGGKLDLLKINFEEACQLLLLNEQNGASLGIRVVGKMIMQTYLIRYLVITEGGSGAILMECGSSTKKDGKCNPVVICTSYSLPSLASISLVVENFKNSFSSQSESIPPSQVSSNVPQECGGLSTHNTLGMLKEERLCAPSPLTTSPRNSFFNLVSHAAFSDDHVKIPLNTLGAGDTCSGVLLASYVNTSDMSLSVRKGLAAASASCLVTESTAHFEIDVMEAIFESIVVTTLTENMDESLSQKKVNP